MGYFDDILHPFGQAFRDKLDAVADAAFRYKRIVGGPGVVVHDRGESAVIWSAPAEQAGGFIYLEVGGTPAAATNSNAWIYNGTQRADMMGGTVPNPWSGTVINGFEVFNSSAAVGVGINVTNPDFFKDYACTAATTTGFSLIPFGRFVTVAYPIVRGSTTFYGFSHPNAIDGVCVSC